MTFLPFPINFELFQVLKFQSLGAMCHLGYFHTYYTPIVTKNAAKQGRNKVSVFSAMRKK